MKSNEYDNDLEKRIGIFRGNEEGRLVLKTMPEMKPEIVFGGKPYTSWSLVIGFGDDLYKIFDYARCSPEVLPTKKGSFNTHRDIFYYYTSLFINEVTSYSILTKKESTRNLIPTVLEKGFIYSNNENTDEPQEIKKGKELVYTEGPYIKLKNLSKSGYNIFDDYSIRSEFEGKRFLRSALICISKIHCAGVGHGDIQGANVFVHL